MKNLFVIGLMSGTSMDGIDVSLLETNGIESRVITPGICHPYSVNTQNLINKFNLFSNKQIVKNPLLYKELSVSLTIDHANAVLKMKSQFPHEVNLIGFHGQTIYHNPKDGISLQIGEPQLLSNITQTKVITNFRNNDIKMGGEGAPLAPIYHNQLIDNYDLNYPSCFINIGGVSNISYCDNNFFSGFDTGPGNGLIDNFLKEKINKPFDLNGRIAKCGKVKENLVKFILKDKFYNKVPPKSLDKLYFKKILFLKEFVSLSLNDAVATLSEITVRSIILSLKFLPKDPKLIIICGGGRKNTYFTDNLKKLCSSKIITSEDINIDGDFIESELIAFISARSYYNLPITFPSTTGVKTPLHGGVIFKPVNKSY